MTCNGDTHDKDNGRRWIIQLVIFIVISQVLANERVGNRILCRFLEWLSEYDIIIFVKWPRSSNIVCYALTTLLNC